MASEPRFERGSQTLAISVVDGRFRAEGDAHATIALDSCFDENGTATPSIEAGWSWDGEQLTIRTDPMGLVPLFYHQTDSTVVVAESLTEIVPHVADPALDYDALSVFLRTGSFLATDTPLRDVKVMPPDSTVVWSGEEVEVPWTLTAPAPTTLSRSEARDTYRELFHDSVRKRAPEGGSYILPLSGGRDSRHILFELAALGHRPHVFTVRGDGPHGSEDVRVARELTARLSLGQRVVEQERFIVRTELEKNELTHHMAVQHRWVMSLMRAMVGTPGTVMDGLAGDVLTNGLYFSKPLLDALRAHRIDDATELLLGSSGSLAHLHPSFAREVSLERARARLAVELRRHLEMPNPIASYVFWNRTRRDVSLVPILMLPRSFDVALPYLDAPLFDFARSLTAEEFGEPGFHDEVITDAFPDFSDIPFERKVGAPVDTDLPLLPPSNVVHLLRAISGSRLVNRPYCWTRAPLFATERDPTERFWWFSSALYLASLEKLIAEAGRG